MKRCPITYEKIPDHKNYSEHGLRLLSPQLKNLKQLELSAEEQRKEAIVRVGKMSIQEIQKKLLLWEDLVNISFLSQEMKKKYIKLLAERGKRLELRR